MRADMAKVATEAPRYRGCSRLTYRDVRPRGHSDIERLEALPSHQGMVRGYVLRGDAKSLSDYLTPLRRFLEGQAGRPWDKVYSELREHLNPRSTTQIHIMGHIEQFVTIHTAMGEDGFVYQLPAKRWGRIRKIDDPGQLYVHPRTGLLRQVPWRRAPWKRSKVAEPCTRVVLGEERELFLRDGIWYWVVFREFDRRPWLDDEGRWHGFGVCDIVTNEPVTAGRYRADKRQASSADLRRHGLENSYEG